MTKHSQTPVFINKKMIIAIGIIAWKKYIYASMLIIIAVIIRNMLSRLKLKTIMLQHKGQANAITSTELAKLLGIKENATHANTRQLVLKCAKECMLPIASTRKGYFIIETKCSCRCNIIKIRFFCYFKTCLLMR